MQTHSIPIRFIEKSGHDRPTQPTVLIGRGKIEVRHFPPGLIRKQSDAAGKHAIAVNQTHMPCVKTVAKPLTRTRRVKSAQPLQMLPHDLNAQGEKRIEISFAGRREVEAGPAPHHQPRMRGQTSVASPAAPSTW